MAAPDRAFLDWLAAFEPPKGAGSNSWIVSGEHTDSGQPLLANDPHLTLFAPPVWYEMHQRTASMSVSGVAFPGVPFVVVGENETGAWGFTNANADVIDFYRYEIDGAGADAQYRYGEEWREFETATRTIEVAGGEDREITVRKTVHGPLLERHGERVGVAWTGLMGSRTSESVYELNRSKGLDSARAALEKFDQPTQCAVYANRDGETYFTVTGLIPRRSTDGEFVAGDRIFDGSTPEGEWVGYEPYGLPDFDGGDWIPHAETPRTTNPDYLATANQRVVDDESLEYYFAESYSPPWRARRIHDRLDERGTADEPFSFAFMREVQRDVYDERAALFVPAILDAREAMSEAARARAEDLDGWDYRMDRDSTGALVFERFLGHYREVVFADALGAVGLDSGYAPGDWVLLTMGADAAWFDREATPPDRETAIATAMADTAAEISETEWEAYGDYNTTAIEHPFDQGFLNYAHLPTDGSPGTVRNFRKESDAGSSYRLLARFDGEPSVSIVPGGNSGEYFSEHYSDQLELWADGEYTDLTATTDGDPAITFREDDP